VFANNFTNHMYVIAEEILQKHKLPFDLIRPLIAETAAKAQEMSPLESQTGPAVRNDQSVIKRQLSLFKKHPELKKIYTGISAEIFRKANPKKIKNKK
jgi:hypothetical protein